VKGLLGQGKVTGVIFSWHQHNLCTGLEREREREYDAINSYQLCSFVFIKGSTEMLSESKVSRNICVCTKPVGE